MRNQPPFRCQQCGGEQAAGHECLRCNTALTDSNDREVVVPRTVRYRIIGRAGKVARVLWLLLTAYGLAAAIGNLDKWDHGGFWIGMIVLVGMLALARVAVQQLWGPGWNDRRRDRRLGRQLRAFGHATRIASADARVRIRGRARVLSPVRLGDIDAAAGLIRAPAEFLNDPHDLGGSPRSIMRQRASCGRFLVDDGADVALVDDDAFEVAPRTGRLPLWQGSILALRDGEEVEVAGPCRRQPVSDPVLRERLLRENYRQASAELLTFVGEADDRIIILCDHIEPLRTSATAPER